MKKLITIFLLFLSIPAYSTTLSGGVKYSVEDAKIELQNSRPNTNFLLTAENFDPNFKENKFYLLKGMTELKDRTLAKFSDSSYAVNYKKDPTHVWYYDKDGVLINAEVRTSLNYPYKSYKYDIDGQLVNMSMKISAKETYIFNQLGQLLGHWIGKNCYNDKGEVVMTREIFGDE